MTERKAEYVLVTGGRNYGDWGRVYSVLDDINPERVIHGGASGADRWAHEWSVTRQRDEEVHRAEWSRHGKAAGPIRNTHMALVLENYRSEGAKVLVVSFPGGRGTAHMTSQARQLGLPVYEV
jgi:hypothetical protein